MFHQKDTISRAYVYSQAVTICCLKYDSKSLNALQQQQGNLECFLI